MSVEQTPENQIDAKLNLLTSNIEKELEWHEKTAQFAQDNTEILSAFFKKSLNIG